MSEISKFIPMDGNGGEMKMENKGAENIEVGNSTFKVCNANKNLPTKQTSFWSRLKGILTYEVKVELTPYQQKIEDEINEFLHQEVTWQSFKNFLFQDVNITTGKKK